MGPQRAAVCGLRSAVCGMRAGLTAFGEGRDPVGETGKAGAGSLRPSVPLSRNELRRAAIALLRVSYAITVARVFSIDLAIVSLGTKPTIWSATFPPLKSNSAGIPRMP